MSVLNPSDLIPLTLPLFTKVCGTEWFVQSKGTVDTSSRLPFETYVD